MSANGGDEKPRVCRDYERGVCNRGNRCKFFHPEGVIQPDKKLPICKDFQNKGCDRLKCKFLHITQEEEADYNNTGILPAHGGRSEKVRAIMTSGPPMMSPMQMGPPPPRFITASAAGGSGGVGSSVCKDFLNNICNRSTCKFRHVTEREYQLEQQLEAANFAASGMNQGMYGKRRRDDYNSDIGESSSRLLEENELLRRKITDLQRQVVDLREMNDTLYDQNTRYRNQLRGVASVSVPSTTDSYREKSYTSTAISVSTASYDGYTKF